MLRTSVLSDDDGEKVPALVLAKLVGDPTKAAAMKPLHVVPVLERVTLYVVPGTYDVSADPPAVGVTVRENPPDVPTLFVPWFGHAEHES